MIRAARRVVLAVTPALPGAASAQPAAPDPAPIGTARMRVDGSIVLDLMARQGRAVGHGHLAYPPGHPDYETIRRYPGGLRVGETRPVPPFP